jgi:hypothetical protein
MVNWELKRDGISMAGFFEDVPNPDNFTFPINNIPVPLNEGTYNFSFNITDQAGNIGSVEWLVTVESAPVFMEFTNIWLGAQASASLGAFYDANNGNVFLLSGANSNQSEIDWFYYVGATNGPTFFGLTDADAVNDDIYGISSWSTKNDTKIVKTTLSYNSVTPSDVLASSIIGTKANSLDLGDVVIFETVDGTRGILEVTSIAAGNDGSITFNSKIIN